MTLGDAQRYELLRAAGWEPAHGGFGLWRDTASGRVYREAQALDRCLADHGLELAADGTVRALGTGVLVLTTTSGLAAFVAGIRWARRAA